MGGVMPGAALPRAPQGRPGFGALGLILIAALTAVGTTALMGQVGALQTESLRMQRHQQTNLLLFQTAMRLAAEAGDPDNDGYRETPQMRTGAGGPTGGGLLPITSAAGKTDAWGRQIGYCAWDYGDVMGLAGRINPGRQSTNATEIAMLVVSAGPDGIFQTSCPADPNGAVPAPGGDDLLVSFTAAEVAQRASLTDEMLAFLNALIRGEYRNGIGSNLDIAGTLTVGSGLPAGTPALFFPDGVIQSLNRRLSQGVYDVETLLPGDQMPMPTCPTGLSPKIHMGLTQGAADGAGTLWSSFKLYADPIGTSAWRVGAIFRTQSGWVDPSPPEIAQMMVLTKCS